MNIKQHYHNFHIVDRSPGPIVCAFAAFYMLLGLALYIHDFSIGYTLFILGFFSVVCGMLLGGRDVIIEATFQGRHTRAVQFGLRFGMILFIVSEIMLFFAFFGAFFHSSLNPVPEIGCVGPPQGIHVLSPGGIPALNTILLLTSGAALTGSHAALVEGDREEMIAGLLVTLVLAILFTLLQVYEYRHAPFDISDGIYGTTFYMLTGLHGFHVIVGTLFLLVALGRGVEHHYTKTRHIGYESAAGYGHFVDVVGIFLFLTVYVGGKGI